MGRSGSFTSVESLDEFARKIVLAASDNRGNRGGSDYIVIRAEVVPGQSCDCYALYTFRARFDVRVSGADNQVKDVVGYSHVLKHGYDEGGFDETAYITEQLAYLRGLVQPKLMDKTQTFIKDNFLIIESAWKTLGITPVHNMVVDGLLAALGMNSPEVEL